MSDNPFRAVIDHANATVAAERALRHPAVAARLRAEGAFCYDDETPEGLTHRRAVRLLELHDLARQAQAQHRAAGAAFETVEGRLGRLYEAVQAVVWRTKAEPLEDRVAAVTLALQGLHSLAAAAEGGAAPDAPPTGRLQFDAETLTVTLDGTAYRLEDPKVFRVYRAIAEAEQPPITNGQIQNLKLGVQGGKGVSRRLAALPQPLRATVRTKTNGHALVLPPAEKA
jgi:hypothetical protein